MKRIYITGHKNPDIDSICAAVAYGDFKSQVDPQHRYIPIRCGSMPPTAKKLFTELGLQSPPLIRDISPQVQDIARRDVVCLDEKDPVFRAIEELDEKTISLIPVFSSEQEFRGVLSIHEISRFLIHGKGGERPVYHFYIPNLTSVIPGYFHKRSQLKEFQAPIMTGAMPYEVSLERIKDLGQKKPILVTGLRVDLVEYALKEQFPAIILTGIQKKDSLPFNLDNYQGSMYISNTDTAETIRLLRLSTPVKDVMDADPPRLSSHDSYDQAKELLLGSSYRGLPVFHGEVFDGIVTRRCFIEKPRPGLILVDHNELSQSVEGADQAEILEIQDHHRLGTIKTREPIFCYSRPVGSTCTIIYGHYKQQGLVPKKEIATLLLAGILSDTVILRSPTTTEEDRKIAAELVELSSYSLDNLGQRLFSSHISLKEKDPKELFFNDFKEYNEKSVRLGIGQVEISRFSELDELKDSFLERLEEEKQIRGLDWLMILFTQVHRGDSRLLLTEFPQGEKALPYKKMEKGLYDLPGVLSRKKQLLPEILRLLEEL